MEAYKNTDKASNIEAYEIGPDYIKIKYTTNSISTYSYDKAGRNHVELLKNLAQSGSGVKRYIHKYLKGLSD